MHTYRNMGDYWCVGFRRDPYGFDEIKDFATEAEAAAYASYLNGGTQVVAGRSTPWQKNPSSDQEPGSAPSSAAQPPAEQEIPPR